MTPPTSGSGQEVSDISRVGLGRVGSGRVGSAGYGGRTGGFRAVHAGGSEVFISTVISPDSYGGLIAYTEGVSDY